MSDTIKIKMVHLALGVDFLGSKTSFVSGRQYDIEAGVYGVKINSKASGRVVIVPYPNVKGMEVLIEGATQTKTGASGRAEQALAEAQSLASKKPVINVTASGIGTVADEPATSEEELKEAAAAARQAARKAAREESARKLAEEKAKGK